MFDIKFCSVKRWRVLMLITAMIIVSSCASSYQSYAHSGVIIDENGVDMVKFSADLQECQQYSSAVPKGERTVITAAQDAVVGGAIGAIFNGSRGAGQGAATGAVVGGVRGAKSAEGEKKQVIRNCLRYRGYNVLN